MRRKEQEDKDRESLDQEMTHDNPIDPPAPSSDTITRGHIPFAELGLVSFTPSKKHAVACLDKVVFDPLRKTIVQRPEKKLKVGTQPEVITVTEKSVMKGTDDDPQLMALIDVAAAQENFYNVDRLKESVDQYKEKMVRVKDTLMKERGKD